MPSREELAARYRKLDDVELAELARSPEELTPEAREALTAEIAMRPMYVPVDDPVNEAPEPIKNPGATVTSWHRGWITVFEAWVALLTGAFLLGFVLAKPELGWNVVWAAFVAAVPVTGLLLVARRSRFAPVFWRATLLLALISALWAVGAGSRPASFKSALVVSWYAGWLFYWVKSRRVSREFSS